MGFANPVRFPLKKLKGLFVIRFPNQITIPTLCEEITNLIETLEEKDFYYLIVVEPGTLRRRSL